ncbi:MAG: hypothetical protein JWN04_4859 [Myxococcaceae bacterium]|nr:hypothetical protein [Myxococcaceae bacterium]
MSEQTRGDLNNQRHTLTRVEAAARLGVSTSTIRRYEWDQLHPQADSRGVWRFDPAEVDAIKNSTSSRKRSTRPSKADTVQRATARRGRVAAQVFRMFARNLSLPQIVVTTRQPPEVVRALYHEWMTGLHDGEWQRTER